METKKNDVSCSTQKETTSMDHEGGDDESTRSLTPERQAPPQRGRPSENAFVNFMATVRPKMPEVSSTELMEKATDLWTEMSEEEREPFFKLAAKARLRRPRRAPCPEVAEVRRGRSRRAEVAESRRSAARSGRSGRASLGRRAGKSVSRRGRGQRSKSRHGHRRN